MKKFINTDFETEYYVVPVKMKTAHFGPFDTVMTQFVTPDPEFNEQDPLYRNILTTPCKMPESQEDFDALFEHGSEYWISPFDCTVIEGIYVPMVPGWPTDLYTE